MKANYYTVLFILLGIISSCTSKQDKALHTTPLVDVSPLLDTTQLLGAGFGINSATLLVQNLDSTRNYYAKVLGFDMPLAEKFQKGIYEGTLSASVSFPDFSSIELLSVKDTALVAAKHSFIASFLQRYEGVRVYSLSTSSIDTTRNWLRSQGFNTDSP